MFPEFSTLDVSALTLVAEDRSTARSCLSAAGAGCPGGQHCWPAMHVLLLLGLLLGGGSAGPVVTRVESFEELPAVLQRRLLCILSSPARGLRFLHILQRPALPVFSQSLVLGLSPASQDRMPASQELVSLDPGL